MSCGFYLRRRELARELENKEKEQVTEQPKAVETQETETADVTEVEDKTETPVTSKQVKKPRKTKK